MGALPDRQTIINSNLRRYFEPMQKRPLNVVRLNPSNTLEHELKKCEIAYKLLSEGCSFICEAKLKNGKRPDIVTLDTPFPICYEIMHSEKDANLDVKREEYMGLRIIGVRT